MYEDCSLLLISDIIAILVAVQIDLLKVNDQLLGVMLGVRQELGRKECKNVV